MSVFCVDNVRDIFVYFQGYGIFRKINYGPLGYLSTYLKGYRILAGLRDMGYWYPLSLNKPQLVLPRNLHILQHVQFF